MWSVGLELIHVCRRRRVSHTGPGARRVVSRAGVNTCMQHDISAPDLGIFLYIDSSTDGVCWHIPLQASGVVMSISSRSCCSRKRSRCRRRCCCCRWRSCCHSNHCVSIETM